MAFFGWATTIRPILCRIPAFVFFAMAGNFGDALQRERIAARQWLFLWYSLAAVVAFGIVDTVFANLEAMGIVRWKLVLLRGLMLLAVGLNAVSFFAVLDSAADMLLRDGAAASSACAVVAVATHLPLVWVAIFDA